MVLALLALVEWTATVDAIYYKYEYTEQNALVIQYIQFVHTAMDQFPEQLNWLIVNSTTTSTSTYNGDGGGILLVVLVVVVVLFVGRG